MQMYSGETQSHLMQSITGVCQTPHLSLSVMAGLRYFSIHTNGFYKIFSCSQYDDTAGSMFVNFTEFVYEVSVESQSIGFLLTWSVDVVNNRENLYSAVIS